MPAGQEDRFEIVIDLLIERLLGHLGYAARRRAPDIVYQNVDTAESFAAGLRHGLDLSILQHVAHMRCELAVVADPRDRFGHRIRVPVDGENLGAFARKQHRRRATIAPAWADTAGAADQRYLSR